MSSNPMFLKGDGRNYHAHLLATTRAIEPGGFGEQATIEWSDTNRRKAGWGPAKAEVLEILELWAERVNGKLLEHGHEIRIDHRSLEAQGIEREATSHPGPAVTGMERRRIETEVGKRLEREALAAAQQRLERAAALGRIARAVGPRKGRGPEHSRERGRKGRNGPGHELPGVAHRVAMLRHIAQAARGDRAHDLLE